MYPSTHRRSACDCLLRHRFAIRRRHTRHGNVLGVPRMGRHMDMGTAPYGDAPYDVFLSFLAAFMWHPRSRDDSKHPLYSTASHPWSAVHVFYALRHPAHGRHSPFVRRGIRRKFRQHRNNRHDRGRRNRNRRSALPHSHQAI